MFLHNVSTGWCHLIHSCHINTFLITVSAKWAKSEKAQIKYFNAGHHIRWPRDLAEKLHTVWQSASQRKVWNGKGDSTSLWPWQWRTPSNYITWRFWSFKIVYKNSDLCIICQKFPVSPATTLGWCRAKQRRLKVKCVVVVLPPHTVGGLPWWLAPTAADAAFLLFTQQSGGWRQDDLALWIPWCDRHHRAMTTCLCLCWY